jgi:hypothetical protein
VDSHGVLSAHPPCAAPAPSSICRCRAPNFSTHPRHTPSAQTLQSMQIVRVVGRLPRGPSAGLSDREMMRSQSVARCGPAPSGARLQDVEGGHARAVAPRDDLRRPLDH